MPSEIVSRKQLAERLGLTSRRVRDLEAEGVILASGRGKYDLADAVRRFNVYRSRDPERLAALADEAEDLILNAMRGLDRLDPEALDLDATRRIGAAIEKADGLLRLLCAVRPEAERAVADHMRRGTIFSVFGDLLLKVSEAQAFERRPAAGRAA